MSLWNKNELLEALSGELLEHHISDDLKVDEVVIDSRKIIKNGLFIAIKGDINDGHNFLEQAFTNGCTVAIIDNPNHQPPTNNHQLILVKDTFRALYKLAEFSRKRSQAKIIAITGSVGKTGTKEMLKLAFSAYGKTFATIGNLNNHIGLPLSLCNFSQDCQFGIFEMGMNHLNEIEPLSKLARPHLAIITNVGPVHIEFFKNEEEIALAKSEIFLGLESEGVALINRDNAHFEFLKKRVEPVKKLLTFGRNPESNYQLQGFKIEAANLSLVSLAINSSDRPKRQISYQILTTSKAAILNSTIVAAALDIFVGDTSLGLNELKNLQTTAGRGKAFEVDFDGKKITIIDDSYNASVLSMKSGLEHAIELKTALGGKFGKKRVIAALGDMLELGKKSPQIHEEVVNYLGQIHIDFAALVGENMNKASKILPQNSYKTFSDSNSASLDIPNLIEDGDILYIKGSRGMKMEKIIEKLTNQTGAH